MDEQSGSENPVQLTSLIFGGSAHDVSYRSEDDPIEHSIMVPGRNENYSNVLPVPQWMYCQQTPQNYVEFLAESSTFVTKAPAFDITEGIALPAGSKHAVNGVSEVQREIPHYNLGKACDFRTADSSLDTDTWSVKPSLNLLNSNDYETSLNIVRFLCSGQNEMIGGERFNVPMERYLWPHNEGEPVSKCTNTQICAKNPTSSTRELNEVNCNAYQPHSRETVAAPGFLSKPSKTYSISRERATANDRRRRLRIAESLKALQELLPCSVAGCKASVLGDVVDHIKYLQLQIKDLSQSRLGGESTSNPFIFLEGYGHYLLHEQMLNEPLEEMIGKLLEENPSAAAQLLESRGLSVMPMALAEGLLQAI